MKWSFSILLIFSNLALASEWQPKTYEKIDLNNKNVSEAMMFVLNAQKNHNSTYSLNYVLDNRVIRTQPIPKEMYLSLKAKLVNTVFKLATKDLDLSCPSRILWKTGEVNKKPTEQMGFCLNPASEQNFAAWYREARRLLQL